MTENLEKALRSRFRLQEFKSLGAPDIITEKEESMLGDRIKSLTKDELLLFESHWNDYNNKSKIEAELDDISINNSFEKYFLTLN